MSDVLKCTTVGELKRALEKFPDDYKLKSTGVDCGGYDAYITNVVEVVKVVSDEDVLWVAGEDDV